jgi:uncharacterized protein Smg (DUF494 family)
MKMDIIESDLKQLFMWIKTIADSLSVLEELCKSQQALIETHQDAIEALEERVYNIEHDLQLVISSSVKNRKDST